MRFTTIVLCLTALLGLARSERGDLVGCYSIANSTGDYWSSVDTAACVQSCIELHYRYALLAPSPAYCRCEDRPGISSLSPDACPDTRDAALGRVSVATVYDTGVLTPGPPSALRLLSADDSSLHVEWESPRATSARVLHYTVRAILVQSYAEDPPPPSATREWRPDGGARRSWLPELLPASRYEVRVSAAGDVGEGPAVMLQADTEVGEPDPPPPVNIASRAGDRGVVHIPRAHNSRGPVTLYRVVVVVETEQRGFVPELLGNASSAAAAGLPYYVAAELDAGDADRDFTLGDRHTYNGYYNAPLPLTNDVSVHLGVVSERARRRRTRYSGGERLIVLNVSGPEPASPAVVALGAAVGGGVVLLLAAVGVLVLVRRRGVRWGWGGARSCSQTLPLSTTQHHPHHDNTHDHDIDIHNHERH